MIFTNYTNGARENIWVGYWSDRDYTQKALRASECFFMVPGTWEL
jgi:hypothetical protein